MFSGFLICALGNCFIILAIGAMAARGFDEHDDPPSTGTTTTRGNTTSRPAGTTTTPPVRWAAAAKLSAVGSMKSWVVPCLPASPTLPIT